MFFKRKRTRTVTFWMNVRFPAHVLEHAYEKPVEQFLSKGGFGALAGNGAFYSTDQTEVLGADFSVKLTAFDDETIDKVVKILEEAGAPVGCAWSFDDSPNEKNSFGTLDGILIRFEVLQKDERETFQTFLREVIDDFHSDHQDTAGFQGAHFAATKVTASFHGFEYDDMKGWLEESINRIGTPFAYEFERTTEPTKSA